VLDQVTFVFVAPLGDTVAVNCRVSPTTSDAVVGLTLTPLTGTVTATAQVALFPPSEVVTVIVAVPDPIPVTSPLGDTMATA
jgi:hypothetical protein